MAIDPLDDHGVPLAMINGWVDPTAVQGQADSKVQSYNFRCSLLYLLFELFCLLIAL